MIRTSQVSIEQINADAARSNLVDTLNSKRGTVGELINDPELATRRSTHRRRSADHHRGHRRGQGLAGQAGQRRHASTPAPTLPSTGWTRSPPIWTRARARAGKLLKDDSLYNNLNSAVSNANQLVAEINAGKGALGKLAKDPGFAQKLDELSPAWTPS